MAKTKKATKKVSPKASAKAKPVKKLPFGGLKKIELSQLGVYASSSK